MKPFDFDQDRPYEVLEHTADTGIRAFGRDLKEVFANAALGMLDIMVDIGGVSERAETTVAVNGDGVEDLMVAWLTEILYVVNVQGFLPKRFEMTAVDDRHVSAKAFGEPIDAGKHELRLDVKAVTYHMLRVATEDDIWEARVIFDV